jgi:hypothetical protein
MSKAWVYFTHEFSVGMFILGMWVGVFYHRYRGYYLNLRHDRTLLRLAGEIMKGFMLRGSAGAVYCWWDWGFEGNRVVELKVFKVCPLQSDPNEIRGQRRRISLSARDADYELTILSADIYISWRENTFLLYSFQQTRNLPVLKQSL